MSVECVDCGARHEVLTRFCRACGARLTERNPVSIRRHGHPPPRERRDEARRTKKGASRRAGWAGSDLAPALWLVGLIAGLNVSEHWIAQVAPLSRGIGTVFYLTIVAAFALFGRDSLRPLFEVGRVRPAHLAAICVAVPALLLTDCAWDRVDLALGSARLRAHAWYFEQGWSAWSSIAFWIAVLVAGEIAYRGILLSRLEGIFPRRHALAAQSVLVAATATSVSMAFRFICIAWVLGWLRQRSGSLLISLAAAIAWGVAEMLTGIA